MTAFEVRATERFEQDLATAHSYYTAQAGHRSAQRFLDEYDLTVERLAVMPSAAVRIGDTGLLWCPVGSFIAVFSIDQGISTVYLLRMFYMTSDWKRLILEEEASLQDEGA